MIKESEIFKIGKLAKTHGVRGEIAFRFENDIFDRVECPYLILDIHGIYVPFFLTEYRFKGSETALLTFQDIDSEDKASKLQGLTVYFPRTYFEETEDDEDAEFSWDYFIGFKAIDQHSGTLGTIIGTDNQTINTLFLIKNENTHDEMIIPATEDFIVKIDSEKKEILMELPEGLIEVE